MGMILRFGADAYMGQQLVGSLQGLEVEREFLDVKVLVVGAGAGQTVSYAVDCLDRSDPDRIDFLPGSAPDVLVLAEDDRAGFLLTPRTRILGVDGWVSHLAGLELERGDTSALRFLFDMGHPTSRIVAVERWLVEDVREGEICLRLSADELKTYPPFLTRL